MNKTILAATIISGFLMVGCGSSDSPEFDRSIGPVDTAKAAPAAVVATPSQPVTVPANMQVTPAGGPAQTVQVQPQQVQTTATPAPAPTAKGMNPPHGQPGHRCDIAVGAPLNSAPTAKPQVQTTTTATQQATPQVVSAPAQTTATPTVTAPGMNPPHGQPGHDCSIAVGAPLKKTN